MICPECRRETDGKLNNRKQLRCTFCYAILPPQKKADVKVEVAEKPAVEPKPKRTSPRKKASK